MGRTLLALPGIGQWTAGYVAMRELRDPDAFLPGDVGVRRSLVALGRDGSPRRAAELAERWRPYRAYALQHLWSHDRCGRTVCEGRSTAEALARTAPGRPPPAGRRQGAGAARTLGRLKRQPPRICDRALLLVACSRGSASSSTRNRRPACLASRSTWTLSRPLYP